MSHITCARSGLAHSDNTQERTREGRKGARREREGMEREKGSKVIEGRGGGKENGDRPPTFFGLKVALFRLIDHATLTFDPLTLKMMSESRVT